MVLCKMNILGLCTVMWLMTIYGVDLYDAECGEYIIVFEETTCHLNNRYMLKPLKMEQINRNNLTYPCNSTNKDQRKKKCLIEFDCLGKQHQCRKHIIPKNIQSHSFIADSHIATPTANTTEAGGLPTIAADNHTVTRVESTTEAGGLPTTAADNHTVTRVESTTEAGGLPTTAADNHTVTRVESTTEAGGLPTTAADNHTVTRVESTTEAGGLPTIAADNPTVTRVESTTEAGGLPTTAADNHTVTRVESTINNNTTIENEIHRKVHEVFNPTTYDINIIYIQNNSGRNNETSKPRNQVLQCKYAELVCENYNLSDFRNYINDTHHYEPPETLQIEISQDETSTVQPLFTGYFPAASNDSTTNYNRNFLGIMSTSCSIQKDGNCKQNIDSLKYINIYLEANYVENNTITKYPNCTKDSLTSKNKLIVKCEDISFAKHNQHITQGQPTSPQKQELWNCQITELKNTLPSKEQRSENNKIHFINCSNKTKIINNKNKSEDINVVHISDIKNLSGMKINKTETASGKEVTNIDISSETNRENIITILITENPNNCSHNSFLNISEGKIIDLGLNNDKEKDLQNNNVEIILSNCLNDHSSEVNNKQSPSKTELIIILKTESFNTSSLKQFNGTLKDESVKQRILLLCDHTIPYVSSNTTSNTTELQCESIDLDLHNITGIEITSSSQIINEKTAIKPENETKQELATWNCIILEEQHKNKLDFGNCSNDVNDSKNKSGENNLTTTSDKKIEISRGKLEQDKDILSKHMIKIVITEKVNNCSKNSSLRIDGGNIIDLGAYNIKKEILENKNVELKLSDCINVKSANINETQAGLKDLTIILKAESLNASDLQQFNRTPKERNVKQKILLRCEHQNRGYRGNTTSNMTVLQCESINLDSYNITDIEIITNSSQSAHINSTKENLKNDEEIDNEIKANANNNFSTNRTVENNDSTVNNRINENKTKEFQKNILESNNNKTKDENKEIRKNISDSKEHFKNQNFNRRKDIPDDMGQNSLALESGETEKILLVALLSIAGGAILIVIVLRVCSKKKEYNPAPTREPRDEEETAF